jgi:hypothetical protein
MQKISINGHKLSFPKEYVVEIFGPNEHNFKDRYIFELPYNAGSKFYYDIISNIINGQSSKIEDCDLEWVIKFIHIHTTVSINSKLRVIERFVKITKIYDAEIKAIINTIVNQEINGSMDKYKFTYTSKDGHEQQYTLYKTNLGNSNRDIKYDDFKIITDEDSIIYMLHKNLTILSFTFDHIIVMLEILYIFRNATSIYDGNVISTECDHRDLINMYPQDHPVVKAFLKFSNRSTKSSEIIAFYKSLE